MAFYMCSSGDGDEQEHGLSDFLGPNHVDTSVRQSLQLLWGILPKEKKSVDHVESEFRRLVDRALRDFREDAERFGKA